MPPVVRFKGIDTVASINRLAAFTGVRFFRSCAIQCLAVTRDGTTCYSTPSTVRSVDIDPFRPESISLLIQIIEGHAPKRITLQQAFDIFAVFEYCLADSLFEMLPEYLDPLLERLNAHEVRGRSTLPVLGPACVLCGAVFAKCMGSSPSKLSTAGSCAPDSGTCCSSPIHGDPCRNVCLQMCGRACSHLPCTQPAGTG